ncbi:hypothetical protein Bca101_072049 [Brassica carinata]
MQADTTSSTCLAAWPGRMHRDTSCLAVPPRAPHGWLHASVSCRMTQPTSRWPAA